MFKTNYTKSETGQNIEVKIKKAKEAEDALPKIKIENFEWEDVKQEKSEPVKIKLEPVESGKNANPTKSKMHKSKQDESPEKEEKAPKLKLTEKLQLHIGKAAASIGQLPIVGPQLHNWMSNMFLSDYVCEVCKRNCSSKQRLTTHMRTHTHEKPYKCESCDSAFARTDHLKNHIINIHTQEKNFECEVCSYKCSSTWKLTVHMRKHSKEKPYKCDICDKQFPYKNSLNVHRQSHSKEKATYKCGLCGNSYDYRSNLNRHIKSVHVRTV